jgi:hypothetical protein
VALPAAFGIKFFDLVVSALLLPLGGVAHRHQAGPAGRPRPPRHIPSPVLIGAGRPAADVAPAALASTFVTSIAGVATFTILSVHQPGSVAPDWPTGIALGLGGLAGGYTGARIQARLPDTLIRRIVGVLVIAIGARYLWSGLS